MIPNRKRLMLAAALGVGTLAALAATTAGASDCRMSEGRAALRQLRALETAPGWRDPQSLAHDLHLSAEQQSAWDGYAATLAPAARDPALQPAAEANAPQRLEDAIGWAQAQEQRAQARLTAMKALYAQLTPEQRQLFDHAQRFAPPWSR